MDSMPEDVPQLLVNDELQPHNETTTPPPDEQITVSEMFKTITSKIQGILDSQVLPTEEDQASLKNMLKWLWFSRVSMDAETDFPERFGLDYEELVRELCLLLEKILRRVGELQELMEGKREAEEKSEVFRWV